MKGNENDLLIEKLTSSPGSPGLPCKHTFTQITHNSIQDPHDQKTNVVNTFMEVIVFLLFLPLHLEDPLTLQIQVDPGGHQVPAVKVHCHHCIMSTYSISCFMMVW